MAESGGAFNPAHAGGACRIQAGPLPDS